MHVCIYVLCKYVLYCMYVYTGWGGMKPQIWGKMKPQIFGDLGRITTDFGRLKPQIFSVEKNAKK